MVSLSNRKQILQYDLVILIATLLLITCGIFFIYSSGYSISSRQSVSNEWQRQILWTVTGLALLLVCSFVDYSIFKTLAPYLYVASIALLAFTLFFGKEVNGASSWLGIGPLGVQPSEFAKLTIVLYLGVYLDRKAENIKKISELLKAILIVSPVVLLTLLQPDLGTALVFFPIAIAMTFVAGASFRHILFLCFTILFMLCFIIFSEWLLVSAEAGRNQYAYFFRNIVFVISGACGIFAIWIASFVGNIRTKKRYFYWINFFTTSIMLSIPVSLIVRVILRDYQKMRLMIFLDPTLDPRGAGWNVLQSLTAIGSGGLSGTGFLKGGQSQYSFLPQQSTDFIFSILSEEWGYAGSMLVLVLFSVIIFRGLRIISNTTDRYATLIGVGIVTMILFHFTINIGMTMGIMPITGIPLLFLSHGGSALWVGMASIGILISLNQFKPFS